MLSYGEREHAYLQGQGGYRSGHLRMALSRPGPSSGQPPARAEAHRPIGPVVLFKDILHAVFTPIREHHDHLIAVSPSDVGLVKDGQSQAVLGLSQVQGGASSLTADGTVCLNCLLTINKAIHLHLPVSLSLVPRPPLATRLPTRGAHIL